MDNTKNLNQKPIYDDWLDDYSEILKTSVDDPILDLGCGRGNDSLYLSERGYQVISCDISEEKLVSVRQNVPGTRCMRIDMREGLPFDDDSFYVVIADLSLHFFSWRETIHIVGDLRRVLKPGGILLCRVNSTNDRHYGAGQGMIIEENYYNYNGVTKRFFDRAQLEKLFSGWKTLNMKEYRMDRYEYPKMLWEAAVRKTEV